MNLRTEGNEAAVKLIKEATNNSPTRAKRILHKWKQTDTTIAKLSPEEAISLIVTVNLTKYQYHILLLYEMQQNNIIIIYICHITIQAKSVTKRLEVPLKHKFGISILHSYIKFFECILHISYLYLDFKQWKNKFRFQLRLLIDIPKSGYGNTNDGNTARRFFQNPTKSVEITALSSNYKINTYTFHAYCQETAKLYVSLYPWYYMPPTVHKILIHGSSIKEIILPIGQLSEEALETNEDLFKRLLLTSDPLISFLQKSSKRQLEIALDVQNLLFINNEESIEFNNNEELNEEI
ncbi:hypothetical protein ACFW04_013877 [Cataglyphis niger]